MVTPDLLRRHIYFSDLSDQGLQKLAAIAEEEFVAAGETVFAEFDPADRFYLIIDGEVNLEYEMGSGEMRVVDTLIDGELLVWSALVEPYRCTATGIAAKDTKLIRFDAAQLRAACEEDRELGFRLLEHIAQLLAGRLEGARVQLAAV
jgi:CRP-like cAMP-binding protein